MNINKQTDGALSLLCTKFRVIYKMVEILTRFYTHRHTVTITKKHFISPNNPPDAEQFNV